jgi:uncharacterized protein YdeI (YjbR/CyaY-like superfamily)
MGKRDPRVDAYIGKAAEFAQPILTHLRDVVHTASPDIEETIKWGVPHFTYKGNLCLMAAFREHCRFGFWKESLVTGNGSDGGMGRKITSVEELPSDRELVAQIRKAAKLNDEGVKVRRTARPKPALRAPAAFMAAVRKNKKALAAYTAFSPSHKREYIEWIAEAKGEDTRKRRIETAVQWIAEGKARNWKYAR